jgi:lipopolysaccharide export system permease protein
MRGLPAIRFRSPLRPTVVTRYFLREVTPPLFIGTIFFTFIFVLEVLSRVVRMVIESEVPILMAIEFFAYMMPFNLAITIPMAVLMACIMAYGRLSGDNEIVAMKASGFSPWIIYTPIFIFGILMFFFMLFFNQVVLSESNFRYRAMHIYISKVKPSVAIEPYQFQDLPGTEKTVSATDIDKGNLVNVTIFDEVLSPSTRAVITARRGVWSNNRPNSPVVTLILYDGLIQEIEKNDPATVNYTPFESLIVNVDRKIDENLGTHRRGLREIPSWEIKERIAEKRARNQDVSNEIIEYQKKFSIPAACLIFVLLGSSLGTFSRRSGKGIGFVISVIIIFVYYILMTTGEILGRLERFPPELVIWVPNIVLGAAGIFFFIKTFRDSQENVVTRLVAWVSGWGIWRMLLMKQKPGDRIGKRKNSMKEKKGTGKRDG